MILEKFFQNFDGYKIILIIFADHAAEQTDPLCQNDELFPIVGKGIPFIDSLNANGAKKVWTEEKTATLIGSPPPSNGNIY